MAEADRDAFDGNENRVAITPSSAVVGADQRGLFTNTQTPTYIAKSILDTSFGQIRWITGYSGCQRDNHVAHDGTSVVATLTHGVHASTQTQTALQLHGTG